MNPINKHPKTALSQCLFYLHYVLIFLIALCLTVCAGQERLVFTPDSDYKDIFLHQNNLLEIENIIETKGGPGKENIPEWLINFINSGTEEVERMEFFTGQYCFIERTEGSNFDALNKWADHFSVFHDFPKLAGTRIERRMVSSASLYPDDEYGAFFEMMIKTAFAAEYSDDFFKDSFWIKKGTNLNEIGYIYEFFIIISIDKEIMQTVINNIIDEVLTAVNPTRVQSSLIRRLQQTFFEEF